MKIDTSSVKTIGVFRALQLGDLICATPALRSLREGFPDAEITLIGLPWAKQLVKRYSQVLDDFLWFPGYPGLPEQEYDACAFENFQEQMRQKKFDLLVQLQGNGTIVNDFLKDCGAARLAGYYNDQSSRPSDFFMQYPDHGPEPLRHLQLMKHIGLPSGSAKLEWPLTDQDRKSFKEVRQSFPEGNYVCIHPGSRGRWRQWSPKNFAAIADHCIRSGRTVVVTGTKDEADITASVLNAMKENAVDLTGKTTLGTIGCLIEDAELIVCNCTGVSHIAAALQTPSVVISMDGEPERWRPLDHSRHKMLDCRTADRYEQIEALVTKALPARNAVFT